MYTKNNIVYSDAGKFLFSGRNVGYQFVGEEVDFTESTITTDDMRIDGNVIRFNGNYGITSIEREYTYADWKKHFIKLRYSNDDQIAIILNGDDTDMQRMQEWRDWSADMAHLVIDLLTNNG